MSILNVDNIKPVGGGSTIHINSGVTSPVIEAGTTHLKVDRLDTNTTFVNSGNIGVNTNSITNENIAGAGNSFHGMYLADGFIAFTTSFHNPSGYYVGEHVNALNAGPVTLVTDMTLDGTWVIV
tara:strand:- start:711 stop:1082 length:372 start_codon:yes stop_codon:yes gene_type:complete